MITSSIPFPPLYWWVKALKNKNITIDLAEHYQKMSYRNRYYLAAPEGKVLLSIPLENGRNQRVAMREVKVSDETNWQSTQWKTIVSLYNRSPFFEFFEPYFKPLFEKTFAYLHEFNLEGIQLINKVLKADLNITVTETFIKNYGPGTIDLRSSLSPQKQYLPELKYYQVFDDRNGFQENCSILDIIFNEGLASLSLLKNAAT